MAISKKKLLLNKVRELEGHVAVLENMQSAYEETNLRLNKMVRHLVMFGLSHEETLNLLVKELNREIDPD